MSRTVRSRLHRASAYGQVVLYTSAGAVKIIKSPRQLHDDLGFVWATSFPVWAVRGIGVSELAAAAALAVPPSAGRRARLAHVAVRGLGLLQIGAVMVNLSTGDRKRLPVNALALALALISDRTTPQTEVAP
jgi:hypothetical protein